MTFICVDNKNSCGSIFHFSKLPLAHRNMPFSTCTFIQRCLQEKHLTAINYAKARHILKPPISVVIIFILIGEITVCSSLERKFIGFED
jgi:hypothetical protein